jgi:signal transduction histidine kinase
MFLFVYFIRSIHKEVKVMVENTERFKRGQPLKPSLAGNDELTEVDAAFHAMADEIREAQRTKQAILSMIFHDLRSPLTTVLMYFSLLVAGAFGEASAAAISGAKQAERNLEQLITLINDLLDLDKIEAGKLAIRPKMLPAAEVIERALDKVSSFAGGRGVSVDRAETDAQIYADPDRIVQVLSNLLSSAVALSPGGSSVAARAVQDNGEVEIRVTSSGASTSSDLLNTQFDRYQRREHGLTLGLPVSRELIKLHGGAIGVTSEQPQGCTFWFRLPAQASS